MIFGQSVGSRLEHIMSCSNLKMGVSEGHKKRETISNEKQQGSEEESIYLRIQGLQQLLLPVPNTVYFTPSGLLGAWQGNREGSSLRRVLPQFLRTSKVRRLRKEHSSGYIVLIDGGEDVSW